MLIETEMSWELNYTCGGANESCGGVAMDLGMIMQVTESEP